VRIHVSSSTFCDDPSPEPDDFLKCSKNTTATIHLKVNADLPTPTPSPESTAPPTPTGHPAFFIATLILGSAITAAVVAVGLFVHFKKRHENKSP
jgi:hypothetical protein